MIRPGKRAMRRSATWAGPALSGKQPISGSGATFELSNVPAKPYLEIFHDEDAEIYINGKLAATLGGYNGSYESISDQPGSR